MVIEYLRDIKKKVLLKYFHPVFVKQRWKGFKGTEIDFSNPKDINEKIQWILCYGDTSRYSKCADKLSVREYISEKGYSDILIPLLGQWKRSSDIDFESLPNKFVLKCNHDSGSYHIIDKRKGFDKESICKDLDEHMKVKYGYVHGEMYYNDIEPWIIAEEFLDDSKKTFSSSAIDYKLWSFDGKPFVFWVCYNRTKEFVFMDVYNLDWTKRPNTIISTNHYRKGEVDVPKPKQLDRMIEIASELSKGFPEVRVDFFEIDGKLYFGELTFASQCGYINYYTQDFLDDLGSHCILPIDK